MLNISNVILDAQNGGAAGEIQENGTLLFKWELTIVEPITLANGQIRPRVVRLTFRPPSGKALLAHEGNGRTTFLGDNGAELVVDVS